MVAERHNVVAHHIHKLNHGHTRLCIIIDIGVARNPVARIHKQNLALSLELLDQRSEARHSLDVGVHIVGRNDVHVAHLLALRLCARHHGEKHY